MALHAPFFIPLLAHSKNGVLAKKEWKHLGSTVEALWKNDAKKQLTTCPAQPFLFTSSYTFDNMSILRSILYFSLTSFADSWACCQ